MDKKAGLTMIHELRRRWIFITAFSGILPAIAGSALFASIIYHFGAGHVGYILLFFVLIYLLILSLMVPWKMKAEKLTAFLDQQHPQLEESSGLLTRPYSSLNTLERLQYEKNLQTLSDIRAPLPLRKKWLQVLIITCIFLMAASVIHFIPKGKTEKQTEAVASLQTPSNSQQPAAFSEIHIGIKPPVYTKKPERQQTNPDLLVEEGAFVEWHITTIQPAETIHYIFNDSMQVTLKPQDSTHRNWYLGKRLMSSGFYSIEINGNPSGLYRIETIKDQPPAIQVLSPLSYTSIEPGMLPQINSRVIITDDYGINEATIHATISSGRGEAVRFREKILNLPGFVPGKTQYDLRKLLSLADFGMQGGDELYFFVSATDNHQQQTKSDISIISIVDTTELMSLEGLASSINVKPEFFRSQRQIIIETEQLLKEKDTISRASFNIRSNNLAIDQKLLRLRYGRFLGEEDESNEFPDHAANGLDDPANFSNAAKIKEAFTEQHDRAEDANFFTPETKKQLKATLTEMWNAELPLRTYKPAEALPFEYKALRLLKELQQQSRAFVAKTNARTTPLDPQKRLSGDLSKVNSIKSQSDFPTDTDPNQPLRDALELMGLLSGSGSATSHEIENLNQASRLLGSQAVANPGKYLGALEALHRIMALLGSQGKVSPTDVKTVGSAMQHILSAPARTITKESDNPARQLSKTYFLNLQQQP